MTFIDNIDKRLKELKISRNKMLSDLRLNRNSFVDWKKRGTIPSASTMSAIAEYLGVSIYDILGDSASYDTRIDIGDTISLEDKEWLSLIHQLPPKARQSFKDKIEGYLMRIEEESVAAEEPLKKVSGKL